MSLKRITHKKDLSGTGDLGSLSRQQFKKNWKPGEKNGFRSSGLDYHDTSGNLRNHFHSGNRFIQTESRTGITSLSPVH